MARVITAGRKAQRPLDIGIFPCGKFEKRDGAKVRRRINANLAIIGVECAKAASGADWMPGATLRAVDRD
jgi:hypothetical protein